MLTEAIRTERLLLRPFRESDYDDLFEFLFQLEDDEFEGYPGDHPGAKGRGSTAPV